MRVKEPNWPFPMETGLSIGNRWGQSIDFEYDRETLDIIKPKGDILNEKDLSKYLNLKSNKEKVEEEESIDTKTLVDISEEEIQENYGDFSTNW